jgi:hypothetical protein
MKNHRNYICGVCEGGRLELHVLQKDRGVSLLGALREVRDSLYMCLFAYRYVCLSVCLCVLYVCLYIGLCVCVVIYVYMNVCMYICFMSLNVCMYVCLSGCLYV